LQHLIKQPSNVGLDALKVGYLSLADFQPLTAKERDALSVMGNLKRSSPDQLIEYGDVPSLACEVQFGTKATRREIAFVVVREDRR
jgi:hypothetical protein